MASSSIKSTGKQRCMVIKPFDILQDISGNSRVKCLEISKEKNKRPYLILVYFNNNKQVFNGKQKAVCYYNYQWCALGYNKELNKPLAGKRLPEIHQYDIQPSVHHYSNQEQERGDEPGEPESKPKPDYTSFLIRHLQLTTPISSQLSSLFQRVPMPIRPIFHIQIIPTMKQSPIAMSQTTAITTTTQHTLQPVQTTPSAPAASSSTSAKCQFYFFTTFHAFATFFCKKHKKAQSSTCQSAF